MPQRQRTPTVEDCRILDVAELLKQLQNAEHPHIGAGSVHWPDGRSVGFRRPSTHESFPCLVLHYSVDGPRIESPINVECVVPIVEEPQRFGGVRYRGRCMLRPFHSLCFRLVDKLYLPPGRVEFGCRQCHELRYRNRHRQRTAYHESLKIADAVDLTDESKRELKEELFPKIRLNIAPEPWDPTSDEPRGIVLF